MKILGQLGRFGEGTAIHTYDAVDASQLINNFGVVLQAVAALQSIRMKDKGFWERRLRLESVINGSGVFSEGEAERIITMEALALMMSELGEAVEGVRKDKVDDHLAEFDSLTVELADVVIRIMDLAGGYGLPIGDAIAKKMAYNLESRGNMHGKHS